MTTAWLSLCRLLLLLFPLLRVGLLLPLLGRGLLFLLPTGFLFLSEQEVERLRDRDVTLRNLEQEQVELVRKNLQIFDDIITDLVRGRIILSP